MVPLRPISGFIVACTGLLSPALHAADGHGNGHGHHPSPSTTAASAPAVVDTTEAEVRHIDRERQRLTLRHGELQGLNMPPMTMVFRVRNPALLNGLQVGTRVRIQVVSEGGSMVVTDLQVLP
ncbi:MAG: copper-binding protein [Inhella sp.]|uniref:copper-binding protein n=1 Tax=Inhella sp. TaxID=1921806 RepID=UPI0022BDA4B8|nr:copper-binding protein [Inhella sp.]MCZ8233554.1 copper-binding protein [Inhella sp.]